MHIANLGLSELILIFLVAIILFGPRSMVKTAREAGQWIKKISRSPFLRDVMATRRELDELPKVLAREAHLDETLQELNQETSKISLSVTETLRDAVREAQIDVNPPQIQENKEVENPRLVDETRQE